MAKRKTPIWAYVLLGLVGAYVAAHLIGFVALVYLNSLWS